MNNKFYFPSIRSNVDSFYVMSLLSKASNLERKGKEIFHFELGEPQISTPDPIIKEIKKMGHNIGLHLYVTHIKEGDWDNLLKSLSFQSYILEKFIDQRC